MNPSRLFILRPVATSLLMVAILLAGAIAYRLLPLSALPEVDYPTIQSSPSIPARARTSRLLDHRAARAPVRADAGLKQCPRPAREGVGDHAAVHLDLTLDVAEQEVQAAINAASNFLPADLPAPRLQQGHPADAPISTLGITPRRCRCRRCKSRRYASRAEASQLPGVGLVTLSGGQRPAVRVQVNPARSRRRPEPGDVRTAIARPTSTRRRAASTARSRLHHRRQRSAALGRDYRA